MWCHFLVISRFPAISTQFQHAIVESKLNGFHQLDSSYRKRCRIVLLHRECLMASKWMSRRAEIRTLRDDSTDAWRGMGCMELCRATREIHRSDGRWKVRQWEAIKGMEMDKEKGKRDNRIISMGYLERLSCRSVSLDPIIFLMNVSLPRDWRPSFEPLSTSPKSSTASPTLTTTTICLTLILRSYRRCCRQSHRMMSCN